MESSNDSPEDLEKIEQGRDPEETFTDKILALLTAFTTNQKDLLHTADYIVKQRAELDDVKEITRKQLQLDMPGTDDELFDLTWDSFKQSMQPKSSKTAKDSAKTEGEHPEVDDLEKIFIAALDIVNKKIPKESASTFIFTLLHAVGKDLSAPHSSRLQASLLTSLIADFEVMIGNLLRLAITEHPNIISGSDKTYTWAEISEFSDLDSFKSRQIDRAIDNLLYGGYESWIEYLEKKIHVDIPKSAREYEIIEIFQRRHIIVHNGGLVSKQYIEKVGALAGQRHLEVGKKLSVSDRYLKTSSDRVLSLGIYLIHVVAKKFVKTEKHLRRLEESIGCDTTYELLHQRRFEAISLLHALVKPASFSNVGTEYRYQVNCWLAAKRTGKLSSHRKALDSWDTSVLDPVFRLAKHALMNELQEGLELASSIQGTASLPMKHWLTWPLLEEIRDYATTKELSPKVSVLTLVPDVVEPTPHS